LNRKGEILQVFAYFPGFCKKAPAEYFTTEALGGV